MSAPLQNDLFLRALLREPTPRTPLWMMRQAGRYLPEYRATRAKAGSFLNLCMNPELACEVTLQPLERYRLDAAILFSDILTIPHAMNVGLEFEAGEGPKIARPVRTPADIDRLPVPDPEGELRYVMDAVRLIRRELKGRVPLIGFAGSPWTVGTYMVEGGGSKNFQHIKGMLYGAPRELHRLLEVITRATLAYLNAQVAAGAQAVMVFDTWGGGSKNFQHIKGMLYGAPLELHRLLDVITRATLAYLNAQVAAGAQAVMVFDTWGGALTPADYREFSLRYMQQIVAGVTRQSEGRRVPVILFTKGGGQWLSDMAQTGCDALGVDWTTDLADARRAVQDRVALQGNLDPSVLYAPPAEIRAQVGRVLASFGHGHGHVFNLGHGIHPDVPPEHALAMVEAVHELSPQYH